MLRPAKADNQIFPRQSGTRKQLRNINPRLKYSY
ncbi:hypothetical protein PanWU01x14_246100 [Parasponia andersonii]|uniref:Uncharacterized protein n=1 Tax=Parasponia andersonii TaxID=3476 RepID=A0A2P5BEL9_PARAD|nr:hypothetical protein PanWU01x14_246100 [Parasponia andersonii]